MGLHDDRRGVRTIYGSGNSYEAAFRAASANGAPAFSAYPALVGMSVYCSRATINRASARQELAS